MFKCCISFTSLLLLAACSFSLVRQEKESQKLVEKWREQGEVIIREELNFEGKTLNLPKGIRLVFMGGAIKNCSISFDSVIIEGDPCFINCTYKGSIIIKKIDDRWFLSPDDMGTFKFLIYNAIVNGAQCDFYRDYRINMNDVSGSGLVSIEGIKSGSDIAFHNSKVLNTTAFSPQTIKPVIVFINVRDVTIRDCSFHDTDKHNARNFKNSSGCTFIQCYGDCDSINLYNCMQENGDCFLRSGLYIHNEKYPDYTPKKGLTNSKLQIRSQNVGYGLALYCGKNLDIDIQTFNPHRGFYCAGVSNSVIKYRGYNPIETKCHILLKDAVFIKKYVNRDAVLDMQGCHDLVIKAEVENLFQNESVVDFSSYGSGKKEGADFTFRSGTCHHYNIDVSVDILQSPETGYYFISRFLSYGGENDEGELYGCKVSNIKIHDVNCENGKSRPYMCKIDPGIDADITIKDCHVSNYNYQKGYGYDYMIKGNSTGKIRITNTPTGDILVREKRNGRFDVEAKGTSSSRSLNYINDKSSRNLVRLIK